MAQSPIDTPIVSLEEEMHAINADIVIIHVASSVHIAL